MRQFKIVVVFLLFIPALVASAFDVGPTRLIQVAEGLFDQSQRDTLGLPIIRGEHYVLYRATKDSYKFCHQQNIGVFQDRIYVMWSNGIDKEDHNGQRVLYCHSQDGVNWSPPTVLAKDPDGMDGPLCCVSAGFHATDDKLVAYYTAIMDGHPVHKLNRLYYQTSWDGNRWTKPDMLMEGFFIESPRRLPSGRLLLCGQHANRQPRLMYSDENDGVSGWTDAEIPRADVFAHPEPSWFRRADGTLVMLFRTTSKTPETWMYASTSSDDGLTWTRPEKTNFPDAEARICAGNLPDGKAYVINNPSHSVNSVYKFIGRRIPLTIALSDDGITFDRAYVIHNSNTTMRFPGTNKLPGWQYPAAVVWRNHLYVAYSINKEDEGITRIALSELTQERDQNADLVK